MANHNVDELLAQLRTQPVRNALRQGPSLQFDQQVSRIAQTLGLDRAVLRERLLEFRAGKGLSFEGLALDPSPTGAGPSRGPEPSSAELAAVAAARASAEGGDAELAAAEAIARRLEADAVAAFAQADAAVERVRELRAARAARDANANPGAGPLDAQQGAAQPDEGQDEPHESAEPHTGA